jgi:hypothetical protein
MSERTSERSTSERLSNAARSATSFAASTPARISATLAKPKPLAASSHIKALRSDCIATRIRIPFSAEKRRLFSDEQVRWMLRTVRHPLFELNICCAIAFYNMHVALAWIIDPFEQRFGSLALVLSLVFFVHALPAISLHVPILARSLLRFDFSSSTSPTP